MTLRAHRRQAAAGAIIGSLVADGLVHHTTSWAERGARSIEHAEGILAGRPVDMDLAPAEAIPAAIHLSGGVPPLLIDPESVELIDLVGSRLERTPDPTLSSGLVERAASIAASGAPFEEAVGAAGEDKDLAVLVGGLIGLFDGLAVVPARLATFVGDGERHGRRYVSRLTERLLGIDHTPFHDPPGRLGPTEVAPGFWVSNVLAVNRFVEDHPDGAVISLCDTEDRLRDHPHRREFHLDDTPDRDANPRLTAVINEVLDEIRAFHAEGRPVLVHCRFGASRTGLVLRAWLMETGRFDDEAALMEAQCIWPKTSTWNKRWAAELRRRHDAADQVGR